MKDFIIEVAATIKFKVEGNSETGAIEKLREVIESNCGQDGALPVDLEEGWYKGRMHVSPLCVIVTATEQPNNPF